MHSRGCCRVLPNGQIVCHASNSLISSEQEQHRSKKAENRLKETDLSIASLSRSDSQAEQQQLAQPCLFHLVSSRQYGRDFELAASPTFCSSMDASPGPTSQRMDPGLPPPRLTRNNLAVLDLCAHPVREWKHIHAATTLPVIASSMPLYRPPVIC